jgi:hypothetical protein
MSTLIKRLRFFAKNAMVRILTKPSLSEKHLASLQDSQSPHISQSQCSNVSHVDTSMENSYQRKYNQLTDSYSGIHEYE